MPSATLSKDPEAHRVHLLSTFEELRAEREALVLSLLPRVPPSTMPTMASTSDSSDTKTNPTDKAGKTNLTDTQSTESAAADATTSPPTEAQVASTLAFARSTAASHISLLHDYNEIKDVAQMLMGLVAEQRGARVVEIMEEFGMDPKD